MAPGACERLEAGREYLRYERAGPTEPNAEAKKTKSCFRHDGMRIRDLIPNKDALITPEYYKRQNLAARTEPETWSSTAVTQNKLTADVRNLAGK